VWKTRVYQHHISNYPSDVFAYLTSWWPGHLPSLPAP
jgi:hypothetical protein